MLHCSTGTSMKFDDDVKVLRCRGVKVRIDTIYALSLHPIPLSLVYYNKQVIVPNSFCQSRFAPATGWVACHCRHLPVALRAASHL